ncbi:unnamed protein product [Prunus armeniaca]|uniref:Uncharacterized protein n=1 Tax=Prunus armeniaca TaxID=36596 RepID=A0A6J5TYL0_PRUAR|nr:unnamed protein product [Prunus armeniaca]
MAVLPVHDMPFTSSLTFLILPPCPIFDCPGSWCNCSLLGDKSPFSQQSLQGDAMDCDEETACIQCRASFLEF